MVPAEQSTTERDGNRIPYTIYVLINLTGTANLTLLIEPLLKIILFAVLVLTTREIKLHYYVPVGTKRIALSLILKLNLELMPIMSFLEHSCSEHRIFMFKT